MKVLAYLRQELNGAGDFVKEYKNLSPQDKDSLKADALVEMDIRGIEIT